MQNKYVTELADYMKYGLLRDLCNPSGADTDGPLKLGVVWHLNPNDEKELRSRDYLKDDEGNRQYRECDPDLYDGLKEIWRSKLLNVASIKDEVLPTGTVYYDKLVPKPKAQRNEWGQGAVRKVSGCDMVFVDPDNGILPLGKNGVPSPKHVSFKELESYAGEGSMRSSLVVFQYRTIDDPIAKQVYDLQARVCANLGLSFVMTSTEAKVHFFVIPAERHWDVLMSRAQAMLKGPWAQHFIMTGSRLC